MNKQKISAIAKKKFQEELARKILIYCYPQKYQNAQLAESPDIINDNLSIGVEVTQSLLSPIQENMSRAIDISGKREEELSLINLKNIQRNQIIAKKLPNGQYLCAFTAWGNLHSIIEAYKRKYFILNKPHFNHYQENNLFILSPLIDQEELQNGIQQILQFSSEKSNQFPHSFHIVYIYTEKELFCICLKNQSVTSIPIPTEILQEISQTSANALEIIVKKHNNNQ